MAGLAIKGLEKISPKMRERVKEVIDQANSQSNLKKIGEFAANLIRVRTRLGKGVSREGGEEFNLDPLAESTKKQRKTKSLSPYTRASKSNLTMFGRMLSAIFHKVEGKTITIDIDSSQHDGGLTNKELASIHQNDKGRPFFHLSSKDMKKIYDFIRTKILKPLLDKAK